MPLKSQGFAASFSEESELPGGIVFFEPERFSETGRAGRVFFFKDVAPHQILPDKGSFLWIRNEISQQNERVGKRRAVKTFGP